MYLPGALIFLFLHLFTAAISLSKGGNGEEETGTNLAELAIRI
jgi:hypothetical protein